MFEIVRAPKIAIRRFPYANIGKRYRKWGVREEGSAIGGPDLQSGQAAVGGARLATIRSEPRATFLDDKCVAVRFIAASQRLRDQPKSSIENNFGEK